MKPLEPAAIDNNEITATARAWLNLWKQGCENTAKVVDSMAGMHVTSEETAFFLLCEYCMETHQDVWLNNKYQVVRKEHAGGLVHLSIRRLDRSALERDWRDYQQIKNQLIGEECEAVELFPAESRKVDNANQFHLWGWSDPSLRVPVGWNSRMVSDDPIGKAQQRPFKEETNDDEEIQ